MRVKQVLFFFEYVLFVMSKENYFIEEVM